MTVSPPIMGQVLGHYRIVEQIGAGGMGVVFRARDEQLDRDVALKTLPKLPLLSEPARRQFRREALSLAKIVDPCVAMAFDFGLDGGVDYLVTEYVPGLTLEAKLAGRSAYKKSLRKRFAGTGWNASLKVQSQYPQGIDERKPRPENGFRTRTCSRAEACASCTIPSHESACSGTPPSFCAPVCA